VLHSEADFNTDGNRTELRIYNDKGVLARRIAMTWEGRKQMVTINYDGAGNMWMRIVHLYDDAGLGTGSVTYNGDGSLHSRWVNKRNERGLVIESTQTDSKGVLLEQINIRYDGPKMLTHERKVYYKNGKLQLLALYVFATGRSETTTFRQDGTVINKSYRDHWDIAQFGADGSLQKVQIISDDHRLIDEVALNKDGSKTRDAETPDELDKHGNWTKKTKWVTDANGTRPVKVTYRALTYY
jgi:hypothetical protein